MKILVHYTRTDSFGVIVIILHCVRSNSVGIFPRLPLQWPVPYHMLNATMRLLMCSSEINGGNANLIQLTHSPVHSLVGFAVHMYLLRPGVQYHQEFDRHALGICTYKGQQV